MPKFEVSVDITRAVAIYEVVAADEEAAISSWAGGKFLSLEQVDAGTATDAFNTFDDSDEDERDDWETDWVAR